MEEQYSKTKIIIPILFTIGAVIYGFFHFRKKNTKKNFIESYIEEIKSIIKSNSDWKFDMNILCHLNFIINEIVDENIKINYSDIQKNRIKLLYDKTEWKKKMKEDLGIQTNIKKHIIEDIFKNEYNIDAISLLPILNFNLINLHENKSWEKLISYPKKEIKEITGKNDKKLIDDAFYFATVQQIGYEKILESNYENLIINEESELLEKKLFFKDDFFDRYGFDCKYLPDLMIYKEGKNAIKLNLLVNKIIY